VTFTWDQMTVDEYADFERAQGEQICRASGIYWRRVRPLFYRPLLPFREYGEVVKRPTLASGLGGCQWAVPTHSKSTANSFLNVLLFQQTASYSLSTLDATRRRQARRALEQFAFRPIRDREQFEREAYPVYVSFYRRTAYGFRVERRRPRGFRRWAELLFSFPKVVVLGAYRRGKLGAVSVSEQVEDTLIFSTFFCDDASLSLHVSGGMLHSVREAAATCPHIRQIFAGAYRGGNGVDRFYLLRGCAVAMRPAYLRVNALAEIVLRHFLSGQYRQLLGQIDNPEAMADIPRPEGAKSLPDAPECVLLRRSIAAGRAEPG
jgi:hypothetical protein